MKKLQKKIDIYFVLIMVFLYTLFNLIFFTTGSLNLYWYILIGIVFLMIIITYLEGIIFGLVTSLVIIFAYGSYVLYLNIYFQQTYQLYDYLWIIIIPVSAYLTGIYGGYIRSLMEESSKLEEQKDELLTRDELTNLYNEREFYHDLEEEISLAKRQNVELALLLIRIKYYRQLVSINGQSKVDRIVKEIAKIIPELIRKEDREYKISQESFAVILPFCDEEYRLVIKDRVRDKLANISIDIEGEREEEFQLDFEIGLVNFDDDIKSIFDFKEKVERELEYDVN